MERYLQHHGIKGQKWGVRRYQNPDGTRIKKSGSPNKAIDFVKKNHKTILKTAMTVASIAGTAYAIKKSGIKVSDVPNLLKWSAKHPVKAASKVTGFETGYDLGMKVGEKIAKTIDGFSRKGSSSKSIKRAHKAVNKYSNMDYQSLKSSASVERARRYLNNSKKVSEMSIKDLKKMDLY